MVVIYIATNGADTPLLIEAVAIVVLGALGSVSAFFCESSGEGDGACGSSPHICGIVGVNNDLNFVACCYSDNCGVNNGIAVGPLVVTVNIGGQIVDNVEPVFTGDGNGKSAVSGCSPGVVVTLAISCNGCLVFTNNEVCRVVHNANRPCELKGVFTLGGDGDDSGHTGVATFNEGSFAAVDGEVHAAYAINSIVGSACGSGNNSSCLGLIISPSEIIDVDRVLSAFAGNGLGICAGLSGGLGSGLRSGLRGGLACGLGSGLRSGLRGGLACGLRGGLRGGIRYGICSLSGSLRSGRFLFLTKVTGSNGEHHNHDNNQGQDAQNVLFSHTRKPPFKIWSSAPWQHYIIIGKFLCDFS